MPLKTAIFLVALPFTKHLTTSFVESHLSFIFFIFPTTEANQLCEDSRSIFINPQRRLSLTLFAELIITCIRLKKRSLAQGADWAKKNMLCRLTTVSILRFGAKLESMNLTR